MRKIDWDEPLSEDDLTWLRSSGILLIEDKIRKNQERFSGSYEEPEVPEDTGTISALDPTARLGEHQPNKPGPVDPTGGEEDSDEEDDETDDYDEWSRSDLEGEVNKRNDLPGTSEVVVVGTGANGNILKSDLIKALRVWDQENLSEG
jgi:hypothetical protein